MMKCKIDLLKMIRRPGIIVLINDTDWEIMEKEGTELKDNDNVSFISTLHGG